MSSIPTNPSNTCSTCGSLTKTTFSDHSRSSRVSELLRSNEPPSDSELSDFQNITKGGPGRIADLDEKIARAREHLAALIHERSVLETNIDDARMLSSPIRRLPSDVLRAIALETIPSPYEVHNSTVLQMESANSLCNMESPWTLAQVSHRWRLTIVNVPEVWSSMSLVIRHGEKPAIVARQMFMTGLRLERATSFPLTISLSSFPESDISNHPLLVLISTRSSSIRNLRIQTSPKSYPVFSWWRGRLDQLYHLTLIAPAQLNWGSPSSESTKSVIDAFEYAPQLKAITLQIDDRFHSHFRLPRTQITHLNLSIIDWKDVEILRQFHNLNGLHIRYRRRPLAVPAGHGVITFQALTSVTLTYHYGRTDPSPSHPQLESDPIFSLLSIPNLTDLRLVYSREFTMFPTIPAPNVLTALRIEFSAANDMTTSSKKLPTLIESVTNLRDLFISSSSMAPSVYDVSFLVVLLVHMPLPHLRTLDFRGSTLRFDYMHKLVEMIETYRKRNRGESQVETVYLPSPLILDPVHARMWQTLIDGGLKVVYGRLE